MHQRGRAGRGNHSDCDQAQALAPLIAQVKCRGQISQHVDRSWRGESAGHRSLLVRDLGQELGQELVRVRVRGLLA